jgi:hypothetical protein
MRVRTIGILITVATVAATAQQVTIRPSSPTHLFYTPTPHVNPPWHVVLGLHEISFSLPGRLQLQASLIDNIGRINLGAKFGITEGVSIGAGLAHSMLRIGRGSHGVPHWARPRFGAFLCFGPDPGRSALSLTPHTQIGDHVSVGFDFGLKLTPSAWWSLIWEVGSSIDLTAYKYSPDRVRLYLNTDGGVRIHPPALPFLFFDLGVDLCEFPVVHNPPITVSPYLDVTFAMVAK